MWEILIAAVNAAYCDRIWGPGGWVFHEGCLEMADGRRVSSRHAVNFHDR